MNLKALTILLFGILLSDCYSYSQNGANSPTRRAVMNFGAALAASNPSIQENDIPLFVQGSISEIEKTTEQLQGTFRYSIGDIASIIIKAKNIQTLAEKRFVKRIEADNPFSKRQILSDTMLIHNRAVPVHAGSAPLSQAYTGGGVVVGIIDTGIDYLHPDFKDNTGKTRIKFLWDQTLLDSVPPLPYNYGQEWTGTDIDNGKATKHISNTAGASFGHGTHVASVGVGNGLAVNKYKGVAPDADIIFVAADLNGQSSIVDATKYIYEKAALLGKPCVINLSLGDYYGSHDGKNLEAQTVKTLIKAQPGRSFVAAAGNSGTSVIHLGYSVTSDTNFTWFSGAAYIAMYADSANFQNIKFSIGADKVTPSYFFRGNIPFSNITPHIGVVGYDTLYNGANRICTIISYGDTSMGVYSMEHIITPDTASYFWRLMATGNGKFDAWTFDVETANLADTVIYPTLKKYKQPDLKSNMVSSFQCLDEVITVGNYTNRNQYVDYDTTLQTDPSRIPGNLFSSSSHGPTRDGRFKPDISAPGDWTLSALVTGSIASNLAAGNSNLMAQGGYHYLSGGTSLASPGVAGIVALYLQMDPLASWLQIKNGIINCARLDVHTGINLPDNNWGYGKADAYLTLTGCATSINSNQHTEFEEFIIYPNPASKQFSIYNLSSRVKTLIVYNLIGEVVLTQPLNSNDSKGASSGETINIHVPAGIYFCTLNDGEKVIATKKLIICE